MNLNKSPSQSFNTGSFKLMCRGQGVRTNGCGTYWIGDTRGMAVLATRATHDGSVFERRKRMATEQIGEPCDWESAEEESSALFHHGDLI